MLTLLVDDAQDMARILASAVARSHQKQALRNMVHLIHGVPQAGNAPKTDRSVSKTASVQACTCGKASNECHANRRDSFSRVQNLTCTHVTAPRCCAEVDLDQLSACAAFGSQSPTFGQEFQQIHPRRSDPKLVDIIWSWHCHVRLLTEPSSCDHSRGCRLLDGQTALKATLLS